MKTPATSKTIWFNALALIAAIGHAFGIDLGLSEEVQSNIVVGGMAVAGIIIRFRTSLPLR